MTKIDMEDEDASEEIVLNSQQQTTSKSQPVTIDESYFYLRPSERDEQDRIEAAGLLVEIGRVAGDLAVSRAIGDFQYKQCPDIGNIFRLPVLVLSFPVQIIQNI